MLGEGMAVVNDTFRSTLRFIDLESGTLVRSISVRAFGRSQWLLVRSMFETAARVIGSLGRSANPQVARPLFLRGLAVHKGKALIGLSPATIMQIDLESGKLEDSFQYSSDVRVCVHGLAIDTASTSDG